MTIRRCWMVGALALLIASGCGKREEAAKLPAETQPEEAVAQEGLTLTGIESTYKDSEGNTLWTVEAASGGGQIVSAQGELKDVKCVLYARNQPSWICQADELSAAKPTQEVRLRGNVKGTSADGERSFGAPEIVWNVKTGEITGGPDVMLRMGPIQMTGKRLFASTVTKKGKVTGGVAGQVLKR